MKNSFLTITDQFCGAGGSSQGARELSRSMGGGLEIKLALNHWKLAIETHNTNFPDTIHDCTDISACDPRRYPKTNVLITSPECTNHSLGKGKKQKKHMDLFEPINPEEERSRATMWDVPRFAEYHDYELIIVENVVDARSWIQWEAWLMAMHLLGYNHKCVYLNSMFCHPTPQSRDRMYVVFWKKGNPTPDLEYNPLAWCTACEKEIAAIQVWRNSQKQWGKYKQQYDYRCPCGTIVQPFYYAAFNCIDWSIKAQKIGDRKRPLAPNTIKRIQYGLEKFGAEPLIITTRYTSGIECRVRQASVEPLPTQPGDASHAILQPFIINTDHSKSNKCFDRSVADPARTLTTANCSGIVVPFIIENYGTSKARSINDRFPCVTSEAKHGIVNTPMIVTHNGKSQSHSILDKIGCISTKERFGLLTPESASSFLSYYYNGSHVASGIHDPARTVTSKDRAALLTHSVTKPRLEDCTYRMIKAHEVQIAMAFEKDYIVLGNAEQKMVQLGNAVTPPAMKFLLTRGIATLA